jgi:hypothetical protein
MRGGRGQRVAHVVQGVEHRHRVVALAGVGVGRGDLEAAPVAHASLGGRLAGPLDRAVVVVEADEPRARVGPGQQDGRGAVAAADVGDPGAHLRPGLHPGIHDWTRLAAYPGRKKRDEVAVGGLVVGT